MNRRIVIAEIPDGRVEPRHFREEVAPIPEPGPGRGAVPDAVRVDRPGQPDVDERADLPRRARRRRRDGGVHAVRAARRDDRVLPGRLAGVGGAAGVRGRADRGARAALASPRRARPERVDRVLRARDRGRKAGRDRGRVRRRGRDRQRRRPAREARRARAWWGSRRPSKLDVLRRARFRRRARPPGAGSQGRLPGRDRRVLRQRRRPAARRRAAADGRARADRVLRDAVGLRRRARRPARARCRGC